MMRLTWLLVTGIALAVSAAAQTVPLTQTALTNQDVLTLAKAGFNEDFIVDTIAMSRTRFDTSVNGVAALAKEGLTERIIRSMMAAGAPEAAAKAPEAEPATPAATRASAPPQDGNSPSKQKTKARVAKPPSAVQEALSTQTAYRESSSMLWGMYKKEVQVGAAARGEQVVAPALGGWFQQVRKPGAAKDASRQ
jgi:uncharacterized membrane protein